MSLNLEHLQYALHIYLFL